MGAGVVCTHSSKTLDLQVGCLSGANVEAANHVIAAANLKGLNIVPGTYTAAAALGLTGKLTLDANHVKDVEWTFQIVSASTTAASAEIAIINPHADYPPTMTTWIAAGAITLGAGTKANDSIMESAGAITIGTGATVRHLQASAAITLGAGAIIETLDAGAAITMGAGIVCAKPDTTLAGVNGCVPNDA
jgi:hypothetical protein